MRRVGGELALALDRLAQPIEREIEGGRHLAELGVGALDRDARAEIAVRHAAGGLVDPLHRRERAAGQQPRAAERRRDADERDHGNRAGQPPQFGPHVADVAADEHRKPAAGDHHLATPGRTCALLAVGGPVTARSGSERSMSWPCVAPHRVVGTGAGVLKVGGHVGWQFDVEGVADAALDRARDGVGAHGQLGIDVGQARAPGHQAHGRADHHDDGNEDDRVPPQQPDAQRISHR